MPPHNGCPFQLKYHRGHGSLNTQDILGPVAGGDSQDGSKDLKNFLIDVGTVWEDQSRGILTRGPIFALPAVGVSLPGLHLDPLLPSSSSFYPSRTLEDKHLSLLLFAVLL